ncbi:hypothetical protein IP88_01190 [alpha proteobacterium AAP81b]|nr:hypothetical protein IP88_01190 [alpha proteobacterium AAP81b]
MDPTPPDRPQPRDPASGAAEPRDAGPRGAEPRGHGCLIAAGMLLGPVVGWFFGQVALGLVGGLLVGIAVAGAMTVLDRRR